MGWSNDFGNQGDMIAKAALAEAKAKDAQRMPRHGASAGWWPDTGTLVRFVLIVFAVIVAVAWTLSAFNH